MAITDYYNKTIDFYSPVAGTPPAHTDVTWILSVSTMGAMWNTSGAKSVLEDGKQIGIDKTIFVAIDVPENNRVLIEDKVYEILHKDDPMGRGHHVEYSLKYLPEVSI